MSKMRVIGVTGRSGSGKSTVAEHYAAQGYPVADGDKLSRMVSQPGSDCLAELAYAFGDGILHVDGTLNRARLAELAFSSPENTGRLVEITHRYIKQELLRRLDAAELAGNKLFFVDGAVIIGGPVQPLCDAIVVVTADYERSIDRITARDGVSRAQAVQRLQAQLPEERLRQVADYVIENNAGLDALLLQADELLAKLLQ